LKEQLTENGMGHGHGETKPSVCLNEVLDMSDARRQPRWQWNSDVPAISLPAEIEVVPAAHKMEPASPLVNMERHA
jgi:hypothetical protein